jgi:hypothetical protein
LRDLKSDRRSLAAGRAAVGLLRLIVWLAVLGGSLGLSAQRALAQQPPEWVGGLEERLFSVLGSPSLRVESDGLTYLFFTGFCAEEECEPDDYIVLRRESVAAARLNDGRRAVLLRAGLMLATAPPPESPAGARGRMTAARVGSGKLRVDGRLDEPIWQRVPFTSDFLTPGPDEGSPARERTEVAFLYDDEALYVGARMLSLNPADLHPLMGRRDRPETAAQLLISLDTFLDRRTAYTFGVTIGGTRVDYYHPEDDESARDYSFDPVWEGRAAILEDGWSVEMRIPFSQFRFQSRGPQIWGVNVKRAEPERYANDYWAVVPMNQAGWASRFGDLVGIEIDEPSRRMEFLPYISGSGSAPIGSEASAWWPQETQWRVGGDFKFGLSPNLTFEATVNPDFGQVEVDPASVNLSAFETFFPEHRPFFVEGGSLLRGRGPQYFYSRRIGSIPTGTMSGGHLEQPWASRILGATKLTGRLPAGLSVGGIAAVTARERAVMADPANGELAAVEVSPLTRFGVARLQQELGSRGSTAGLTLTAVQRDLDAGSHLHDILNRNALAGGADWNLRFLEGSYQLSGDLGFSFIEGDSGAILRAQHSSARYFQRPDAHYVALDPSLRSLSGYTGSFRLVKLAGNRWLWEAAASAKSPGFEINDAGALGLADRIETSATLRYREYPPDGRFHGYEFALFTASGWNYGAARQFTTPGLFGSITWRNLLTTYAQASVETRAASDKITWGGPLVATPFGIKASMGLSTDYAARTRWSASGSYFEDEWGQWSYTAHGGLSLRPLSRLAMGIEPGYAQVSNARHLITHLPGGPPESYGRRYVFSSFARRDLYAQLRVEYTLNPDLTLQFFGMPLASSGRFDRYGELVDSRTGELRLYQPGWQIRENPDGTLTIRHGAEITHLANPDYNIRWFRSNLVIRWEWQPGSTLFLIWQQGRYAYDTKLDMIVPTALWDAMSDPGSNSLAFKFTYRFAPR